MRVPEPEPFSELDGVGDFGPPLESSVGYPAPTLPPRTLGGRKGRSARKGRKSRAGGLAETWSSLVPQLPWLVAGGSVAVVLLVALFKTRLDALFVASLLSLGIGTVWLWVVAFQERGWLGPFMVTFSPPQSLGFVFGNWARAGKPFLLQLLGAGLLVGHVFLTSGALSELGAQLAGGGTLDPPVMKGDSSDLFHIDEVPVPEFPELGAGRPLPEYHCQLYTVDLNGSGPGGRMRMYVYVPSGRWAKGSLGCVLVGVAGSPLIVGTKLEDESYHAEAAPYVVAGYVAVRYSLDGALDDPTHASDAEFLRAHAAFRAAAAGVVNTRNAFEFVVQRLPQVDPERIYLAGHSSAGTLSLLAAEHLKQVAGCMAYAPVTDVQGHLEEVLDQSMLDVLNRIRGFGEFVRRSSPSTHVEELTCPVFLYHSRLDEVVSYSQSADFAERLRQLGRDVTLVTGDSPGHYDTMIEEGIPAAIDWLREHDSQGTATPTEAQPTEPVVAERSEPVAEKPFAPLVAQRSVQTQPNTEDAATTRTSPSDLAPAARVDKPSLAVSATEPATAQPRPNVSTPSLASSSTSRVRRPWSPPVPRLPRIRSSRLRGRVGGGIQGYYFYKHTDYRGRLDINTAARRALDPIPFFVPGTARVDPKNHEVVVRVRGSVVNGGLGAAALRARGFTIRGQGLRPTPTPQHPSSSQPGQSFGSF